MKTQILWFLVIFLFCCTVVGVIVFKILSGKLETSYETTLTSKTVQSIKKKQADRERVGSPARKVKESSEIEKEFSFESMTDEELEEVLAWLEELEKQDEVIEQAKHNEERDNSSSTYSSWSVNVPQSENSSQSKPAEEVLDFLTNWPASGKYYMRDILHYKPDLIDPNWKEWIESRLAEDPDAVMNYSNPRDPNSGVVWAAPDGTYIPASEYFAHEEYYMRLYGLAN